MPDLTVLVLGGTSEGRALAQAAPPGIRMISSLAGRTSAPLLPYGPVRIGGFGGVPGLVAYLRAERIGAIVDATHPFAATMTAHAVAAAEATGLPLLLVRRPGWTEQPGDEWHRVPSLTAAAALVPKLGERVFLTTGRQTVAAFAGVRQCWFLARSVEPPVPPVPGRLEVLLDRGPFTVDSERALLAVHRIDVLVSKDSGGVAAKLVAARDRHIPVILVDRPAVPPAATAAVDRPAGSAARTVATVATVEAAVSWLAALIRAAI